MLTQPRRYMSKRQRPCDFCRSRKTACRIDQAPPCRLCVLHGRDCTFVEAAAPRKRIALADGADTHQDRTSPRSTFENNMPTGLLSHSMEQIEGDERSEDATMNFGDNFNFETTQSEFEAMFRSPYPPGTPSAMPMNSTPVPGSTDTTREMTYPAQANPQLMGLSSDMDPLLLRHYQFDANSMFRFKELAVHSVQESPIPIQFLVSQQSLFSRNREEVGLEKIEEAEIREELDKVVPSEVGNRLLRLYGRFINVRWPVFGTLQPPDSSSTPPHLLAAIYAISLPFAIQDDRLSVDVAYEKPAYPALSRIIDKALTYEVHSPSIATVQTLLLLVLRPSSDFLVADTAYRWDLLARLVSCATTLGLHLDPSRWSIAPWQRAHRRRLSYLIYAVDTWLSCSLGRPNLIHGDNWLVTSVEHDDLVDSGLQSEDATQLFEFSAITMTLSSVFSKLYSSRAIDMLHEDLQKTLALTRPLLQDLDAFSKLGTLSSTVSRLALLYVQLTILRAEIRPVGSSASGHSRTDLSGRFRCSRELVKECICALLSLIRDLSPDTDNGFWPPWTQYAFSSICFTLMTMAVASSDLEEASSWVVDLQATRKSLRLKVASFPFLRLGLLRIDALFWRGISNVLHLEPHVAEAFKAAEST